jgi:hypothetical protein
MTVKRLAIHWKRRIQSQGLNGKLGRFIQSSLVNNQVDLTLSVDLLIRYANVKMASKIFSAIFNAYEKNTRAWRFQLEDNLWLAHHDPNLPIAKWITKVKKAASDLNTTNNSVIFSCVEDNS